MADNYLEKRMEEYRSGRLASTNRTSASMRAPRKDNQLTLTFPKMTVVILAEELDELVTETVTAFTSVGVRVAFTSTTARVSTVLAQKTGARFYPCNVYLEDMLEDVNKRWGGIDVILPFTFSLYFKLQFKYERDIPPRIIGAYNWWERLGSQCPPQILARHLLYLSHPENMFLNFNI